LISDWLWPCFYFASDTSEVAFPLACSEAE